MKDEEWKLSVDIILTDTQDRPSKHYIVALVNEFYTALQDDKFAVHVSKFSLEKIEKGD
jgi:hypothetical protein